MSIFNHRRHETIEKVLARSRNYVQRFNKVNDDTSLTDLISLRNEISELMTSIKSRWMGNRLMRLKKENKQVLSATFTELAKAELQLASRIVEAEADSKVFRRIEELVLPDDIGDFPERDVSTWNRSPFNFPARLLARLATAPLPN